MGHVFYMKKGKESSTPAFKRVGYVRFTGEQYIPLGFNATGTMHFSFRGTPDDYKNRFLCGSNGDNVDWLYAVRTILLSGVNRYIQFHYGTQVTKRIACQTDEELTISFNGDVFQVNGRHENPVEESFVSSELILGNALYRKVFDPRYGYSGIFNELTIGNPEYPDHHYIPIQLRDGTYTVYDEVDKKIMDVKGNKLYGP